MAPALSILCAEKDAPRHRRSTAMSNKEAAIQKHSRNEVFTFRMRTLLNSMKSPRSTVAIRGVLMRLSVAMAVACFSMVGLATANPAHAAVRKTTNIPAQGLAPALELFAKEREIQIVYRSDFVGDRETSGAVGELTVEEALTKLLSGTGLTFQYLEHDGIAILPVSSGTQSSLPQPLSVSDEIHLAQAEAPSAASVSGQSEALAETSGPEDAGLEEVIVTSQKRAERLQDVPISVSVLSGEDLDRATIRDVTEALSRVAGIAIQNDVQGGNTQVTVRGVAAAGGISVGASPVAYYLDSAPFGFVSSAFVPPADAYDLERVEVLRGPQGTLYGSSALNGVVRVLTRDADLSQFEVKARGFGSNTKDGGWSYRGDMAVNVPIVEGKLAARAVLGYQSLSGWIDQPNRKDVNDTEGRVARIKLNAQPTEQLSIGLSAWHSQIDLGGGALGDSERQRFYPGEEPISTDYDVYGLKVGYEFPAFAVTSMTSYLDLENTYDLGLGVLGPDTLLHLPVRFSARTFAQEVALSSTHAGPWRWTAGAMYRDSEDDVGWTIPPLWTLIPAANTDTSESYAVFGEVTRSFMDGRWDLTVGGRYFEDRVGQVETSRSEIDPDTTPLSTRGDTFYATTPRVILTWHRGPQLNLYASYSEGFRSGWPQSPLVPFPEVQPDTLTNYELGSKGTFLDGRLAFDAALYYMDWEDVQLVLSVPIPGTDLCCSAGGVNGAAASGLGVDFSVTASPADALELGVSVSWNDLTVDGQVYSNGELLFDRGDRLNGSSEYTLGVFADYIVPFGASDYEGHFSISANYTSAPVTYELDANGQREVWPGDPSLIARTSFSIRAADRWTTTFFVDNLNDERPNPNLRPTDTGPGADEAYSVRPRTVGVQIEYHFN